MHYTNLLAETWYSVAVIGLVITTGLVFPVTNKCTQDITLVPEVLRQLLGSGYQDTRFSLDYNV